MTGTLDGFVADQVPGSTPTSIENAGWGCDSRKDTIWRPNPGSLISRVPACVPDYSLDPERYPYGGAYRPTRSNTCPR